MGRKSDYIGRRFGRLTVISDTGRRTSGNVIWRCKCDCGNVADIPTRHLASGMVVSCGCKRLQNSFDNLAGDISSKIGLVDGTNVSRIASRKPQRNNTSGFRGVSLWRRKGRQDSWIAYIYFKGKRYYLGAYQDKMDAVKARQSAEEKIHGTFLQWYYEQHPNKRPK